MRAKESQVLAASGRLERVSEGGSDARIIVHRWVCEGFEHTFDEVCLCGPTVLAGDDPRSMDEIMDDLEEQEREELRGH